jgi:hypothetical protein
MYLLASSLTAALLDGLFAHPTGHFDADTAHELAAVYCAANEFFRSLLDVLVNGTVSTGKSARD